MSQIFADQLDLMWENRLSIDRAGKTGVWGLAPQINLVEVTPSRTSETLICSNECTCFIIDLHA